MPLVDAKCTNCGRPLKVDNTQDAAICEYCGSAFIVEKAINNYNLTNNNVNGNTSNDFVIRAGTLIQYRGSNDNVIIPNGVKRIGADAFRQPVFTANYNSDSEFIGLDITSVFIPEGVVLIGEHAFKDCKLLKSINIPSTVKTIGRGAFEGCYNLETVTIKEGLQEISDDAFQACFYINMTIPASVTKISLSFLSCSNRNYNISISPRNPYYAWENNALFSKDKTLLISHYGPLNNYTVPNGVKVICRAAFMSKKGDSSSCLRYFPDENGYYSGIRKGAYSYAGIVRRPTQGQSKVFLPDSIEEIQERALYEVGEVVFPANKNNRRIRIGKEACYEYWRKTGKCPVCGGRLHKTLKKIQGWEYRYTTTVIACVRCAYYREK